MVPTDIVSPLLSVSYHCGTVTERESEREEAEENLLIEMKYLFIYLIEIKSTLYILNCFNDLLYLCMSNTNIFLVGYFVPSDERLKLSVGVR